MRSTVVAAAVVVALSALTGCIEFEEQTLLIKADPENDVVRLRLIYHGIYAGESPEKDLPELAKVGERGTRFFLLDNWPLEVDVGKPEKGEEATPVSVLLRRYGTKVANGTFYRDERGRLCAWQDVEFANASKVLKSLGALVNLAIVTGKADVLDDADPETRTMWTNAALTGHAWFRIDREGVHFEFPISDADAARVKREFVLALVKEAQDEGEGTGGAGAAAPADDGEEAGEEARPATEPRAESEGEAEAALAAPGEEITDFEAILRMLARNKLSWVHRGDRVTVTLAADDDGVATGHAWNEGRYVPNLRDEDLPERVDPEMTTRKLVDSF